MSSSVSDFRGMIAGVRCAGQSDRTHLSPPSMISLVTTMTFQEHFGPKDYCCEKRKGEEGQERKKVFHTSGVGLKRLHHVNLQ